MMQTWRCQTPESVILSRVVSNLKALMQKFLPHMDIFLYLVFLNRTRQITSDYSIGPFLWTREMPTSFIFIARLGQTITVWPQSRRKKFPKFSRLFQSHSYTFPEVYRNKNFGKLSAFNAIFSHISTVHAQKRLF